MNINNLSKKFINKSSTAFIFLIIAVLGFFGISGALEFIGVPLGYALFNDTRVITAGAESFNQGYDPLVENPAMPTKNVMNYPRIWHLLFSIGLTQEHTLIFGALLTVLYLLGLLFTITRCSTPLGKWMIILCAISPASMLAMERGNIDLFIFFLFSLALLIQGRALIISASILIFSSFLKIFPFFVLPILLIQKNKRLAILTFIGAVSICLLYFYLIRDDLILISQGTPRASDLSYGKNVVFDAFSRIPKIWSWIGVLISLLSAYFVGQVVLKFQGDSLIEYDGTVFFVAACLIYVGTFLIGNNWDYRLIFLIFAIPFLTSLIQKSQSQKTILYAKTFIGAILLSMWYLLIKKYLGINPFFIRFFLILDECANWGIFVLCSAFLMRWRLYLLRNL